MAPITLDLAGRGAAEALLRAALGFQLGHFPFLDRGCGDKACPGALTRGLLPIEGAGYSRAHWRMQGGGRPRMMHRRRIATPDPRGPFKYQFCGDSRMW